MPIITLLDGNKYQYDNPVSTLNVANDINSTLAKSCIAGKINGKLIDATDKIKYDAQLTIVTIKDKISLDIIRRSCTYLIGNAIKQLWPTTKMVIGITVDKGFYYDIDIDETLTDRDVDLVDRRMHELINKNNHFLKKTVNWKQARDIFLARQETYKVMMLDEEINKNSYVQLYYHEDYVDICNGPNVPNMHFCRYFKLQKISGAYWRDNNKNKMLQRVHGTAWKNNKQLINYVNNLEKAEKRDHRKIGKQLDLYHIQKEAPGMIFWHNDGWIIFRELKSFIRIKLKKYKYQEVKGPFMTDRVLWEKTGHLENYSQYIFTTLSEHHEYCIKPMNCSGHIQIFNQSLRSYRDLPLRIAEFGSCHRNEPSGALHGLMRVREFTQDDAHIFCMKNQIHDEVNNCIKMIYDVYEVFGFKKIKVVLSTRPKIRIGNNEMWDQLEKDLTLVLVQNNIIFEQQSGEGAFYGPKIEFILFDCLDRAWQCGTIQLDFSLPKLLDAFYIDENNKKVVPVMIHRAILGSIERFIGILTEEYEGFYPIWLAPTQVVLMNISNNQLNYVEKLTEKLSIAGIRVKSDLRNEKIGFKIREHTLRKIPYMLICGNEEMENNKISIRTRHGENLGTHDTDDFIKMLQKKILNYNHQ